MAYASIRNLLVAIIAGSFASVALADPPVASAAATLTDPTIPADTPLPTYPPKSRAKREAGIVRLKLCIDASGRVTKADLDQSSGFPRLDQAVVKWADGLRLNPATLDGSPVTICDFPFKYEFQVTKSPTQPPTRTTNPFDVGPASGMAAGP